MSQKLSIVLLIAANFLIPVAILVFATGFFPYKTFIPGRAQFEDDGEHEPPPFDKVIFMVVDALRRSIPPSRRIDQDLTSTAISSTHMAQAFNSPRGRSDFSPRYPVADRTE